MSEPTFSIETITADNAAKVPAVFQEIYGNDYPIRYVYDAGLLMAEITSERLAASLVTDADGKPVAYVSCYKCAPNPQLWEAGNLLVIPEFSTSNLPLKLIDHLLHSALLSTGKSDGIFGEAVCHHYFTQVSCAKEGMTDCAIALDQLDGTSFKEHRPETARVACLLQFMEHTDPDCPCYLPDPYFDALLGSVDQLRPRHPQRGEAPLPTQGETEHQDIWYASAGTWRVSVRRTGGAWEDFIDTLCEQALQRQAISVQIVLAADQPWMNAAVQALRQRGFFLGGIFPRWFGADGIMMQKVIGKTPDFDGIKLYTRTAKNLLSFIRADCQSLSLPLKP